MDLDQIKNLSPQQKQAYADLTRMFESTGWALVVERMAQRSSDCAARQMNAANWDQSVLMRGARLAYDEIATLAEQVDHEFALIASANAEQEAQSDESKYE